MATLLKMPIEADKQGENSSKPSQASEQSCVDSVTAACVTLVLACSTPVNGVREQEQCGAG